MKLTSKFLKQAYEDSPEHYFNLLTKYKTDCVYKIQTLLKLSNQSKQNAIIIYNDYIFYIFTNDFSLLPNNLKLKQEQWIEILKMFLKFYKSDNLMILEMFDRYKEFLKTI